MAIMSMLPMPASGEAGVAIRWPRSNGADHQPWYAVRDHHPAMRPQGELEDLPVGGIGQPGGGLAAQPTALTGPLTASSPTHTPWTGSF